MEPDSGTNDGEGRGAPVRAMPWRSRAAGALVVVVGMLAVAAWSVGASRPPDGSWVTAAAAVAAGLVALAAMAADWRRSVLAREESAIALVPRKNGPRIGSGVAVALVGVAVAAVGSGVVRPRREVEVPAPDGLSGEGFLRIETWWPLVVVGAVAVVVGLVLAFGRRPRGSAVDARGRAAVVSGAVLLSGLVTIAVVWHEVATYAWVSGRPRRRHGRRLRSGPPTAGPGTADPAGWWREAAADEAASIAAFEELAERLTAVGAPAGLVERARGAARDEVRHARTCARLAGGAPPARIGPRPDGPAGRRAVPRRVAVVGLAVESLVDGVVGEGFAAARLRAGAATASDPAARASLRAMARDEERHAELGADIATWCREQSPRLVGAALRRVAARLPAETSLPETQRSADPAVLRAAGMVELAVAQPLWDRSRAAARSAVAGPVPVLPGRMG